MESIPTTLLFFNTPKLDPKIDFRKKVNLYMSFSFLTGKIKYFSVSVLHKVSFDRAYYGGSATANLLLFKIKSTF